MTSLLYINRNVKPSPVEREAFRLRFGVSKRRLGVYLPPEDLDWVRANGGATILKNLINAAITYEFQHGNLALYHDYVEERPTNVEKFEVLVPDSFFDWVRDRAARNGVAKSEAVSMFFRWLISEGKK